MEVFGGNACQPVKSYYYNLQKWTLRVFLTKELQSLIGVSDTFSFTPATNDRPMLSTSHH